MSRAVLFDEFGGPEVLHVVDEPVLEPAPGEVRVRIEAAAVNPLDAMMRAGISPAPVPIPHARLGVEGTGVIDALGSGVTGVDVGDPIIVAAIADPALRGSYAEHITLPATQVIARPDGLGVIEAAASWVGYSTAYGALVEKAGMRPGDVVLVTAASGSVGRAALQIARHLGAVPIAVTRHAARRDEVLETGASAVVALDEAEGVAEAVRRRTDGAGADIVLDLVRGPGQQDLVDAARPGATLVVAGFLDPRPTPFPSAPSLRIFTYRSFEHTLDATVVARMSAALDAAVRLGSYRPAIDRVFALDQTADAHRHLDGRGRESGKIVITI